MDYPNNVANNSPVQTEDKSKWCKKKSKYKKRTKKDKKTN
jgi:hypothetical protein